MNRVVGFCLMLGMGVTSIGADSVWMKPVQWVRDYMTTPVSSNPWQANATQDVTIQSKAPTLVLEKRLSRYIQIMNPALVESKRNEIVAHIIEQSRSHDIDPTLIAAIIAVESRFNPTASHGGALGLGQLMGETARRLGVKNPFSIADNINGTVRYTAHHYKKWTKSPFQTEFTLASYLMGSVKSSQPNQLPTRVQQYIQRVQLQQKRINDLGG